MVRTTTRLSGARLERRRVVSTPPAPGMFRSMITTSGARSAARRIAFSPFSASPTTLTPSSSRRFRRPVRKRSWSSTTSTRTPASVAAGAGGGGTAFGTAPSECASGRETTNVAPLPAPSLCAVRVPPWSSTKFFASASPSPSPACARVLELSAWRKRSKMNGRTSALMPRPMSRTTISIWPSAFARRTSTRPPWGVNFTALLRRFQTTCWSRFGSPVIGPIRSCRSVLSSMDLASAAGRTASSAASMTGGSSTLCTSRRSLPAVMRPMSSRSSMSCTWAFEFRMIVSIALARVTSSSCPVFKIAAHPYTALSGVRSSCERVVRNSSLARFALSASARAACSRASRSARSRSIDLRIVMSRAILDAPTTWLSEPRTGETVSDTSTGRPSLRTRTVSKWSTLCPERMRESTVSSSCWRSGGMIMVMFCPTASSAV